MDATPNPADLARAFVDAIGSRDPQRLRPLLDPDVFYLNIGMLPAVGIEATVAHVAGQWSTCSEVFDFEIVHLVAEGPVVLTERIDTVGANGSVWPLPVMGAFEVRDGRITSWRDYWDPTLMAKMRAGEDVSALVPPRSVITP